MFFFCFGIIACFSIFQSNGQMIPPLEEQCLTTMGTQSACISITECNPLLDLLKKFKNLQPVEKETLKKSQCGFEGNIPKVCCPNDTQVTEIMKDSSAGSPVSKMIPVPPDVSKHPNLRFVNNEICGPLTESKITLGSQTTVFEFPWMALIAHNITGRKSSQFTCGGSLITKRYVITAAHCVTELDSRTKLSGVRIGEYDLSEERDCDEGHEVPTSCADKYQDFLIENVHIHGDYLKSTHQNDIALIRMNGDANFGPLNVRPICLPIGDAAILQSDKVIVSGWGTTEIGIRSQKLLKVQLEIGSNDECVKIYRQNYNVNVTYRQLCAGGKDSKDTCTGDSGGPLQYPAIFDGVPKYVQYGIINFGPTKCGVLGFPGVYLKVVYYMDWILDNIKE